jgi:hypothetical protein
MLKRHIKRTFKESWIIRLFLQQFLMMLKIEIELIPLTK